MFEQVELIQAKKLKKIKDYIKKLIRISTENLSNTRHNTTHGTSEGTGVT